MINLKNNVEILAPAGSMEAMKSACSAGADAVYIGGMSFGARAFANNLTNEDMLYAIDYVHSIGKKLYLTVNTLLTDRELYDRLYEYIAPFYEQGLDAAIVQDLGVIRFLHLNFPKLPLHASTQMTINNADAVYYLKDTGLTRIVTSRELCFDEIKKIKQASGLEIESFVHGALCYSYSGQCLFSSMSGGRSGNRGRCAQPCRMEYELFDPEGKKIKSNGNYLLSPKDICLLQSIPDLIDSGIDSFKIEGRMKKPEYSAYTAYLYRKWADRYFSLGKGAYNDYIASHQDELKKDLTALSDLYNRGGFTSGYYYVHNGSEMITKERPNHYGVEAVVLTDHDKRSMKLKALTDINAHDVIEIRQDGRALYEFTTGSFVSSGDTFRMNYMPGTVLTNQLKGYRIRNNELIDDINERFCNKKAQLKINGSLKARIGEPVTIKAFSTFDGEMLSAKITGNVCNAAQKAPLDKERILSILNQTGDTDYSFNDIQLDIDDNIFIPVSELKALRRDLLKQFCSEVCGHYRRNAVKKQNTFISSSALNDRNAHINVIVHTKEQLEAVLLFQDIDIVYLSSESSIFLSDLNTFGKMITDSQKKFGVVLPALFRQEIKDVFSKHAPDADRYLVKDPGQLEYMKSLGIENERIRFDHNMYVWNKEAAEYHFQKGYKAFTAPLEKSFNATDPYYDTEFVAYGRVPLMISAQCLAKTCTGCKHDHPHFNLKSKTNGFIYPAVGVCDYCYNVIYDREPFDLRSFIPSILDKGFASIRYEFIFESAKEVCNVLSGKELSKAPYIGHFESGVE